MALAHLAAAGEAVMRLLLGTILQGLVIGCVISLLAAGATIIYRSTRVLNFAQGSLATLNTYLYYQVAVLWGWPAFAALPAVLLAAALTGVAAELVAVRPLRRADPQTRSVGTIALVLIVQWAVHTVWGPQQRFLPAMWSGGASIGGVTFGTQHLAIVLATVAVGAGLGIALSRTRAGLALAASAQDAEAARLLGIGPRAVSLATFALASVVGAVGGILATPLLVLTPSQMTLVFVVALGAALAGGFQSLPITVAAGLGLGVLQSLVATYVPVGGLPQAAGFLSVLLVLAVMRRRVDLVDVLRGTAR